MSFRSIIPVEVPPCPSTPGGPGRAADSAERIVRSDQEPRRCRGAGGQTTVLAVALVAIAVLVAAAIGHLGGASVDRARARTAADSAALAAVVDEADGTGAGRPTAIDVARRNGAVVEAYEVDGTSVEVRVRVGAARATSRADRVLVEP